MASPLNSSPTTVLPGSIGIPASSPVYIDGIPAASVETTSRSAHSNHKFWSSQAHLPGSETEENLVISLAHNRIINYISVQVSHFPCDMAVLYWDNAIGQWLPVRRENGSLLIYNIRGSVPKQVNSASAFTSEKHPYHFGNGHWISFDDDLEDFSADKLRFTAVRPAPSRAADAGNYPVDQAGKIVPYPIGIQNLDFGFSIRNPDDVPWTFRSPLSLTERQAILAAEDVNGSPVEVVVRENRATDLLRGLTWRCGPQPRADSVVSLYVDARDGNGDPQVIDRFYLEPVTSGPKLNLYYAPDPPPPVEFQAVDDPVLFPLVSVAGSQLPTADENGWLFPAVPGWVTLSNQGLGTTASVPWWVGMEISPQFSSADSGNYMIADSDVLQLNYQDGTWQVLLGDGVLASWAFDFAVGDTLHFFAGYDGQQVFAWTPGAPMAVVPESGVVPTASTFRFGASLEAEQQGSPWPGNYRLSAFVLKQEWVDTSNGPPFPFGEFSAGGADYVAPDDGPGPTTVNSLCRFAGAFVLGTTNPTGFVGGPASSFEACTWVPITRDYALAQGYLEFDPVLASVFKFEFTSLTPEPVDYIEPAGQPMKTFRPTGVASSDASSTQAVLDPGHQVTQNIVGTLQYGDQPPQTDPPAPGVSLPTEAMYVTDPVAASATAQQGGSLYNFHQWQPDTASANGQRQQVTVGGHTYVDLNVVQVSKIGYYVGISDLVMYRVSYISGDDTDQYTETFQDTLHIDPTSLSSSGAWVWAPGSLTSPYGGALPAQVQSPIFASSHKVMGVQFATIQSPPVQLLSDPDFSDPALANWASVGDALPLTVAPVNAQFGNMVQITRTGGATGWAFLMSSFATWAALTAAAATWGSLASNNDANQLGGVAYAGTPVATTGAGRIYAAARVFANSGLSAPLSLQLLDGATGAVLAEADQAVTGGGLTEWFVGYTLGSATATAGTWSTMMSTYSTWAAILAAGQFSAQLQMWTFESGTQSWTGQNATVAQSSAWVSSGSFSLLITATSAASGAGFWQGDSPSFPVNPGQLYGATANVEAPAALSAVQLSLNWFDSGHNYISTASPAATTAIGAGAVAALQIIGAVAPSNAAFVQVVPNTHANLTAGTQMAVDDVILWQTTGPQWGTLDTTVPPSGTTITAQLIQKETSSDTWDVDSLAVFEDSIVWEFSNDGGSSWWAAYDVRNNPRGVMKFPPPAQGNGNQLMWRVQGYAPGLTVSSLVIRPWYSVWPTGILPRPGGMAFGPNLSPADHYTAVENDPRWQVDAGPVPAFWYFGTRQILQLTVPAEPGPAGPAAAPFVLGHALVFIPPEAVPVATPTFSDIYGDTFTDTFGYADAGDVYTDAFSDTYGTDYSDPAGSGYNDQIQLSQALVIGSLKDGMATSSSAVTSSATGATFTPVRPVIGANVGQVTGNGLEVQSFIALTGQALQIRRVSFGNQIPTGLGGSLVAADAGVREVSMDFQPDATTSPLQLDAFLASCAAGGLSGDVTIWAKVAPETFDSPEEYFAILQDYVPVIRRNGFNHVWAVQNSDIVHNDALERWYPGDDLVDVIAPTFFAQALAPGDPGTDTLAEIGNFANAHQIPLGLTEFGVDSSQFTEAQGDAFLRYVSEFFSRRAALGKPNGNLLYLSAGSFSLTLSPDSRVALYRQISAEL